MFKESLDILLISIITLFVITIGIDLLAFDRSKKKLSIICTIIEVCCVFVLIIICWFMCRGGL